MAGGAAEPVVTGGGNLGQFGEVRREEELEIEKLTRVKMTF